MSINAQPRVLFISRAYPPVLGGIENQNYELSQWLAKVTPTTTIANTKGKKALPFFLPWMMARLLFLMRNYDVLLVGDGVLAILIWWIKPFFPHKKYVSVVHGLDLTYKLTLYQKLWLGHFLPMCDRLIAVGNHTIHEGVARGISQEKFSFVPNGIHPEKFTAKNYSRDDLINFIGTKHKEHKVIVTTGRLARRKGVAWFIRNVLPHLGDKVIYAVAGDGVDRENIQSAIEETKQQAKVLLLGRVSDQQRDTLMHAGDLFVQPNIKIDGDMEGFGISVIEAGVSGITVLAAELEGLKDAIKDGQNGFLVPSEDTDAWVEKIEQLLSSDFDRTAFGKKAREYVIDHYSWDKIAKQYLKVLSSL